MDNSASYPRPHLDGGGPACPRCSGTRTKAVKYTWWGGVLGPKLMNLYKCEGCRCQFNSKTGKEAAVAILVYIAVSVVVVLAIVIGGRLVFQNP